MKALALILLLLLLNGCADCAKVAAENRELRSALDMHESSLYELSIEIMHWRREAQIAAACDYIVPLCPESMTRLGRAALAQGEYSGGGAMFWVLVALKFSAYVAVCIVFFALALLLPHRLWLWIVEPARADVDSARATVRDARSAAFSAEERARAAEHRLAELSSETTEQNARLDDVLEQIERAQSELETLKSARAAISGL